MNIYIDTLGCAKNEYDSQMLAASLVDRGCRITEEAGEADIIIVNTCGFIEAAKRESINRILELAEEAKDVKLVVCGCLAEKYHEDLARELPEVDMFFGVNDYDDLPERLMSTTDNIDIKNADLVGDGLVDLRYRKRVFQEGAHYGYLKIAEGCDNSCSFCAIPSIRGSFRSKKIEDCIREARDMANAEIKELILIAQDSSQYGKDLYGEVRLPELLRRLAEIEGIEWIRLLYVYDNGITDELIEVIKNEPKICKYIDMPIQHISDNVLKRMRRASRGDSIKSTIKKLRSEIPDVHIRTTLLVGFPGETEEDFNELLDFIDEYQIDRLGAFAYSDEDGTAAYDMDNKNSKDICELRRDAVMERQYSVSEGLNEKAVGRVFEVIVDEIVNDSDDPAEESLLYVGRTRYDAPEIDCEVIFMASEILSRGDIVNVLINNAYEYDLEGEFVGRGEII
ncbi:MAG: 30S ribosomal protein S12 methylthiotransferase RimO [Mogibacterium sp.]|nr:30S ribosomal protein S12 methylthiotransferase RimO [Mogibacterium sp.]